MNAKEETRLFNAVAALLGRATVSMAFRYDLTALVAETKINLPRRRIFDKVSDLLTTFDMVKLVGEWVVAEIEGTRVQFCRLSANFDEYGNGEVDAIRKTLGKEIDEDADDEDADD